MTPERHQQICDLLYQVLDLQPDQRDSFLEQACQADRDLRQEVDVLLSGNDEVRSSFFRLSTVRLLAPGTRVGDFEIESMIGSGGMSEVYRARDLQLPRQVAIKVISYYLAADQKQMRRFQQEAEAAASINHPNILTVFKLGTHEGAPYLVSELLEGETLRERLRKGRIPLAEAVELAIQAARGLAAAHEKGIVHRDLKPENLFITRHGQVKILDFGLAKLMEGFDRAPNPDGSPQHSLLRTEPGIIMGTTGYMSPEQARGQPLDTRSDIFSFGAVLYEMITGKPAFQRQTKADSISSVLNQQPPALAKTVRRVPAALQRVIDRSLEKLPEGRYPDASELVAALQALPRTYSVPLTQVLTFASIVILLIAGYVFRDKLVELASRIWPHHPPPGPQLVERPLTANPPENPVRTAAVSRDWKYVAYTDNSDKVNLLLVASGDVHSLSLDSSYEPVDWFPDGLHLLLSRRLGQRGLWKFSTWDSSLEKLWDGAVARAVVSPDGSTIAFSPEENVDEIWSMSATGEAPHRVAGPVPGYLWGLAWSPDGKRLAYVRVNGTYDKHESAIETCNLSGGERTSVLAEPKLFGRDGAFGLVWLGDGRIVYSISTRLDEYNLWSVRVRADGRPAPPPAGPPQPITRWQDFFAPSFQATADGKHLVVVKKHSEDSVYLGALAANAHAFKPRRLTVDDWRNVGYGWTADGKDVLLFSQRNGTYAIRRQAADGSQAETLVYGPENYRDPVVSSSGTLLYNSFSSPDGVVDPASWRLMSTPLSGGPKTTLMAGRYSYRCGIAPSSPCVVAQLQPDSQLIFSWLDPVKGKGQEITRVTNYNGKTAHWSLSPDASRIALTAESKADSVQIIDVQTRKLTAWPVHTSEPRLMADVFWAADGKRLFVISSTNASTTLASVGPNGAWTMLYDLPFSRGFIKVPLPSPDGRFVAFTQRTYISNLVLLENF
jgi:serine/threonine protein kinase